MKNVEGTYVEGNVGPFSKVFYGSEIFSEKKESVKKTKKSDEESAVSSTSS